MRDFFITLLTAAVIGAVVSALPDGAMSKYVRYIAALICVTVIVSPLKPIVDSVTSALPSFSGEYEDTVSGVQASDVIGLKAKKDTSEYICALIYEKMGIKPYAVNIEIESTDENISVGAITVILEEADKQECAAVSQYLENVLGAVISVE